MTKIGSYITHDPPSKHTDLTHVASVQADAGDLAYWDDTAAKIKPASSFTDHGTEALTQRAFAAWFAGLAQSGQTSGDSTARGAVLWPDQEVTSYPNASTTFVVGDYVAPTYTAGVLSDQQLTKVTDPTRAIGVVTKVYSSATTTIKVRLSSRFLNGLLGDLKAWANTTARPGQNAGDAGGTAGCTGGRGGPHTTGTAGQGGAGTWTGGDGGTATGAAGIGGAGAAGTFSGGAGGDSSSSSGGNAGAGGTVTSRGGAGGAASGTGAAAGGAGAAATYGGGNGGTAAGTSAGGVGGASNFVSGDGGAKTGTGAAAGGAAGALNITGGVGGATASSGSDAGGAGASINITSGAGGAASAGTGNGGAAGNINLTPGAGGTSAGGTAGARGLVVATGLVRKAGSTAVAITGATALTQADSGGIFTVSQGSAYDIDLPSPTTGPGLSFLFHLTGAASNNVTITVLGGAATFVGTIVNDVTSVLPATGSTLTFASGVAALGDNIEIRSIATNLYHVRAVSSANGGITIA